MKRLLLTLGILLGISPGLAIAQQPIRRPTSEPAPHDAGKEAADAKSQAILFPHREQKRVHVEPLPTGVTPELYYYQQEIQRHDDPAQAVRRKAETRASQRVARIEALHWSGLSKSRPGLLTDPSPRAGSGFVFLNRYGNFWGGYSAASSVYVENHYQVLR